LAARALAEAEDRKADAIKAWAVAREAEWEAARALAITVPDRLAMQINPHQAPPPLDLLRRLASLAA
jgi:hypothetical protein